MNTRNYNNVAGDEYDYTEESYNTWDGVDRRGRGDRRYHQIPPPQQYYIQQPTQSDSKNIAQTTLTLQQIGGIVIVLSSIFVSGFSAWSNLNKELDLNKHEFEQFKIQVSKDLQDFEKTINELKKLNDDLRATQQKTAETYDNRLRELDSTVSQMFQKINR